MKRVPKEEVEIIKKNLTQVSDILKANGYDVCAANVDNVARDTLECIKMVNETVPKEVPDDI